MEDNLPQSTSGLEILTKNVRNDKIIVQAKVIYEKRAVLTFFYWCELFSDYEIKK